MLTASRLWRAAACRQGPFRRSSSIPSPRDSSAMAGSGTPSVAFSGPCTKAAEEMPSYKLCGCCPFGQQSNTPALTPVGVCSRKRWLHVPVEPASVRRAFTYVAMALLAQ